MAGLLHRWNISPWLGIPLLVSWLLVLLVVGLTVLEGRFLCPAVALVLLSLVSLAIVVLFRRGVSPAWRIASLLVLVACIPLSHRHGDHRCMDCGSEERAEEFGWGIQDDWVVLADFGDVVPSHAYRDLFDPGHEHRWLGHGRVGGAFILNSPVTKGSIYCGEWLLNDFALKYEESASFRDEVKERIRTGEATREEIRRLIGLARWPMQTRPLPKGTHALLQRAGAWLGGPVWPEIRREEWPPESGT